MLYKYYLIAENKYGGTFKTKMIHGKCLKYHGAPFGNRAL